ncbi:uncharacterized protein LOC141860211 isoform X2 [Acropora palmata]|uniref:uncharacterized protein LOC141860211 isoform X2 n=1 Tax=Acropora palmata TaxID=6131 RepID=UPI003DA0E410
MHTDILLFWFIRLQVNVDSVTNKWNKLRQQYKTHLDNGKGSGTECDSGDFQDSDADSYKDEVNEDEQLEG